MRINAKFYGVAFAAATAALAACTNELTYTDSNQNGSNVVNLVHAPDVYAWSGSQNIGNVYSVATRTSAQPYGFYKAQDYQLNDNLLETNPTMYAIMSNAPQTVSDDEWNFVKAYLAEHPNEGYTECNLKDYFIQWAGKSYAYYDGFYDNNGAAHNVIGSNNMDYIEIDGVHLNDYNGSWGPIAYCENWPLNDPSYHDSYGDKNNIKHDMYRFYYIQYNGKWGLYLCFDYTTEKNNGEYLAGDNIFNDWVLKISPADGSVPMPPVEGGNTQPEGGDNTGGSGDDNNTGDDNTGDDNTGDDDNIVMSRHDDEVEVNYAINDVHKNGDEQKYDNADLWTKLSIHVRKGTDVRITVPLPTKYFCESDDLVILQEHEFNYTHPEDQVNNTVTYTIVKDENTSWTMTLTVDLNVDKDELTVTTDGINQQLIDYLFETNGDGINFEIWNYFQTEAIKKIEGSEESVVTGTLTDEEYEAFKGYLDKSTIEFLDENPAYYINAFNDFFGNGVNTWDCTVKPLYQDWKKFSTDMYHLNTGALNVIYYYTDEPDDAHTLKGE